MDYVIERTHVIDHERFLEAGPHARDLWEWGMKYSGKFELDGAIPMAAVLASPWGYGGRANIRAANRLVEVGLWERTEKGFQILRWTEQGNKTHAELEAAREAARKKKATQRANSEKRRKSEPPSECPPGTPRGTPQGTPEGVLNSPSYSSSESGSSSRIRSDLPDRSGGAPEWWPAAVGAAEQVVGTIDDSEALWVQYDAARDRKGWARNHRDAVGWLTAVRRREQRDVTSAVGIRAERQPLTNTEHWVKTGSDL